MALPAGRYGVTKNQLLKIKKLPMNTIKLIEELTEKFDLLGSAAFKNSTSAVTESSDLVESGAVKDIVGWGNKNKLPITLESIKKANTAGAWNGNTYTRAGITYTINTDNNGNVVNIVANGTVSDSQVNSELNLCPNNTYYLPAGSYILSGGVSYNARIFYYNGTSYYNSRPDEVNFDVSGNENTTRYTIAITPGTTVNNAVFKPMIRKATVSDSTYEPYHESVEESLNDKMSYADNGVLGAKQFLPLSLEGIKELNSSRTWNGNSCSHNGITFTVNTDSKGSVTSISTSGTSTGFAFLRLASVSKLSGSFKLNGGISNNVFVYIQNETTSTQVARSETGDIDVNLSPTNDIINCIVGINPASGGTNTIYPMLRLATDTDPTYQPYAQTNRELTVNKCDNSVIAPVENGTTASQAYAVGSHAIRNGAFITWKNAKAQGESINDASDYTSGDVASCLIKQATFSGTTSAQGNLRICNNLTDIIVAVKFNTEYILSAGVWHAGTEQGIQVVETNGQLFTEKAVSGTYYYI